MIEPRWIDRDTIEVPAVALAPGIIGDGADLVKVGDPAWGVWASWLIRKGKDRPARRAARNT